MKKPRIIIGLVISLFVIPSILTVFMAPTVKGDDYIYGQELTYDVKKWNGSLLWYFSSNEGYVDTSEGGEIRVNYTGFYDYENPWSSYPNVFEDPIPFVNVSFYEKNEDGLALNRTMANRSTGEVANVMNLGYNEFDAGFFIPTDNFSRLNERVLAQDINTTYVNYQGPHKCEILSETIKITFIQSYGAQETHLIYDKLSGILLWASTEFNNYQLEMQLEGSNIDTSPDRIPAFPIYVIVAITGITILVSIFIKRKKFKH